MKVSGFAQAKQHTVLSRFRQLSLVKKGAIVLVVLILLWFVGVKVFGQKSNNQYQTATAVRGNIISTVSESGNVSANSKIDVTSPSTGIIQAVYVKNGDYVTAGQNLFEVKSTATPQEKASAFATYESALSSYQSAVQTKQSVQATLEKDRQAVLDAQTAVNNIQNSETQLQKDSTNSTLTSARETFTADETKYNNADTAIAAANAQLNSASLSYQATQDSVVTAPFSGTVANLSVREGASVTASASNANAFSSNASNSSGSNSNANSSNSSSNTSSGSSTTDGSTVLVIGDFSQLSVVAQVNEVDIPKIKNGQNATVTIDAFPNETFVGKVVSVDSVGTATSGVVTYNVYIDLVSPPSSIKSGMTTSVNIQTARRDNVITVPTAAVQTINDQSYVRVLKKNKVSEVPVTTGIADDTNTEITSGINEGDVVITGTTTTSGTSQTSPFGGGFGGNRGGGGGAVLFRRGG